LFISPPFLFQGFVLRCGPLEFDSMSRIPYPDGFDSSIPNLWLVLDEVVDPQNLGALMRSSFFLGSNRMGVLVCSKNSAPPSPVVSAASAGALELLDVYSTSSLPRTLSSALEDGFRIIGAASSKPRGVEDDENVQLYDLQDLPVSDQPTLLVLGSEGHGLRTLVAKLCTDFVRIPRGDHLETDDNDQEGGTVDSLNVSVTGGILLWHLLHGGGAQR
jgi:21S rRNA (GM2251-2'-O)-methyltransferase